MNPEGYQDRTAENAIAHAARNERPPQIVTDLVHALRREAHRWGFEIISIHAPHAGRDVTSLSGSIVQNISIHAPHAGRDISGPTHG